MFCLTLVKSKRKYTYGTNTPYLHHSIFGLADGSSERRRALSSFPLLIWCCHSPRAKSLGYCSHRFSVAPGKNGADRKTSKKNGITLSCIRSFFVAQGFLRWQPCYRLYPSRLPHKHHQYKNTEMFYYRPRLVRRWNAYC